MIQSVYLTKELLKKLKERAEQESRSISWVIREAIKKYFIGG